MESGSRTVHLACREGGSDKVYHLSLEPFGDGWSTVFANGRRGGTLSTGRKTGANPVSHEAASKVFEKVLRQKIGGGYTVTDDGGDPSHVAAGTPRRQTGMAAMLLAEADAATVESLLDDPRWCMQEKHDGRRLLCRVEDGEDGAVTAANRRGEECGLPTAVDRALRALRSETGRGFELDGECCGEEMRVFDLMRDGTDDLRGEPYETRLSRLVALMGGSKVGAAVVSTHHTPGHKRAAFAALKARGAEGVVFRDRQGIYVPGRPAGPCVIHKHKFVATLSAIVAAGREGRRSVGLELIGDDGARVPVGNVTVPANQEVPAEGAVVEVRYLYAYADGSLYQPVLLVGRDDVRPEECLASQRKFKQDAA